MIKIKTKKQGNLEAKLATIIGPEELNAIISDPYNPDHETSTLKQATITTINTMITNLGTKGICRDLTKYLTEVESDKTYSQAPSRFYAIWKTNRIDLERSGLNIEDFKLAYQITDAYFDKVQK